MAIAVTKVAQWKNGNKREGIYTIAISGTYASSGGESLTPAQLGMRVVEWFSPAFNIDGYVGHYSIANSKFGVFYGDNNNASDGPLIEVPSGTLTESFRVNVKGY